ncbi:MAG: disulfide bond formation protein B [Ramlibacter sp.]|nr:disulfide bond formation protein B [Ramlibacter sp.]MCW5648197.1 disulfide bond formation protein B [Ramlibacter sp.]
MELHWRTGGSVSRSPQNRPSRAGQLMLIAWLVSLVATAAALFIGEVMGRVPCVLCWYQRIAMFPLVVVLGAGVLRQDHAMVLPALVLAAAGWFVAGYHTLLYWGWIDPAITPCGSGPSCKQAVLQVLGAFDLPFVSWLAFTVIVLALAVSLKGNKHV